MITIRDRLPRLIAKPRPKVEPQQPPPPRGRDRIARQLALAHLLERLVNEGVLDGYADAARVLVVSRARISQVVDLALLSPTIQEGILLGTGHLSARGLRAASRCVAWQDQKRARGKEAEMSKVRSEPVGGCVA